MSEDLLELRKDYVEHGEANTYVLRYIYKLEKELREAEERVKKETAMEIIKMSEDMGYVDAISYEYEIGTLRDDIKKQFGLEE